MSETERKYYSVYFPIVIYAAVSSGPLIRLGKRPSRSAFISPVSALGLFPVCITPLVSACFRQASFLLVSSKCQTVFCRQVIHTNELQCLRKVQVFTGVIQAECRRALCAFGNL